MSDVEVEDFAKQVVAIREELWRKCRRDEAGLLGFQREVWRDMCKDYLNGLLFGKESVD